MSAPIVTDAQCAVSLPVRFSNLKRFAQSPLHYLDAVTRDTDETLSMRLGSGAHALILGKPVVTFDGVRNEKSKAWQEFQAEHAGKVILNRRETDEASGIASAITGHRLAMRAIEGCTLEQTLQWSVGGVDARGTPDAFNHALLVELKTTRSSDPRWFIRDAIRRHYHAQLAWYQDGIDRAGLPKPPELCIIAVESVRPHPVVVYRLSERAVEMGRRLCKLWLEQYLACAQSGSWPGYTESLLELDVDDDTDLQLVVDGEEIAL